MGLVLKQLDQDTSKRCIGPAEEQSKDCNALTSISAYQFFDPCGNTPSSSDPCSWRMPIPSKRTCLVTGALAAS